MNILFEHSGVLPVKTYGGTERILYWHMVELVRQGHRVTLVGDPRCQVADVGIRLIPKGEKNWYGSIPAETDIVHLFYNHTLPVEIPLINTIEGNGQPGERFPLNSVFVSRKHARNHGSDCFVYNGIDLKEYPYFSEGKKRWRDFLFLAKASWRVKNLVGARHVCKKTAKHLHVVGGRTWWPHRHVTNYGMLGGEEKLAAIRRCDALLFPVRWHEPFGIAVIEAMSQGLPVLASPYGSLPELITPETGVICRNGEEMVEALEHSRSWDREAIRRHVEEHFSIATFTRRYLELYQKVMEGKRLNDAPPAWKYSQRAETLLNF